jgi:uncharacterized membrane protein YoaK (UPF0700 family)
METLSMCGMNLFRFGMSIVNTSTQVVQGAAGGLDFLRNNLPQPVKKITGWTALTSLLNGDKDRALDCATNSHAISMTVKGGLAVDEIGDQFK